MASVECFSMLSIFVCKTSNQFDATKSYELNKIINKDVLWFFIKIVLQKITKTHDNVCCALTPRYYLLQDKKYRGLKEHYTSIKMYIRF